MQSPAGASAGVPEPEAAGTKHRKGDYLVTINRTYRYFQVCHGLYGIGCLTVLSELAFETL